MKNCDCAYDPLKILIESEFTFINKKGNIRAI
jgi:hypothetical protein